MSQSRGGTKKEARQYDLAYDTLAEEACLGFWNRKHGVTAQLDKVEGCADLGYPERDFFQLAENIKALDPMASETREGLMKRVRERQAEVAYDGAYRKWIEDNKPPEFC